MKYDYANNFPDPILFEEIEPFISLYLPTHPHSPQDMQDQILFKNLVTKVETALLEKYNEEETAKILEPFHEIRKDKNFWNNPSSGLAVLANANHCVAFKLRIPVKSLVVVANNFHIKPLIENYQSPLKYQILTFSAKMFSLFEGNDDSIREIEFEPNTPRTLVDVLGNQYTEKYQSVRMTSAGAASVYAGRGSKTDEEQKDMIRYFKIVDRFITDNYSKRSKLPLILASPEEYHGLFRKLSNNPYLMDESIKGAFDRINLDKLKDSADEVMRNAYYRKMKETLLQYNEANQISTENFGQIIEAAVDNRIHTIFIEKDKIMIGKIDDNTGEIIPGDVNGLQQSDLLNDLSNLVIKNKGQVIVLPKEIMPTTTGIAALFRY